jgi:hypothetical protein
MTHLETQETGLNRSLGRLRALLAAMTVIAAMAASMAGSEAARADAPFPAYAHSASFNLCGFTSISPDSVVAFRSSQNRPERVSWTARLQWRSPTGAWYDVQGSTFPWMTFPAAGIAPGTGWQIGGLVTVNLPQWTPAVSGTYRYISQFYWWTAKRYSYWEASKACYLTAINVTLPPAYRAPWDPGVDVTVNF